MLIDSVDSYYMTIQRQMAIISPGQLFAGVIQARDFPMTPPLQNALYLLVISAQPIGGTESQNLYEILCQWTWLSIGTDIQPNQQAANRGDRYRASMAIVNSLRNANFPSYCAKSTISSVDAEGDLTVTPINGPAVGGAESIWWSKLSFQPKQDNPKSGIVYGAASVRIYCYDDVMASVA